VRRVLAACKSVCLCRLRFARRPPDLRSDGDTQACADVLALSVRTYYMPTEDWHTICQRCRALREAEGTLTGHAAGQDTTPVLDHAAATVSSTVPRPGILDNAQATCGTLRC
jgi:hypothetical protein